MIAAMFGSSTRADDGAVDLVVAFAEPARVAATWVVEPSWELLALSGLTILLLALARSHDERVASA